MATMSEYVELQAENERLRKVEAAALRVASSRRDGVVTDVGALDRLDAALEGRIHDESQCWEPCGDLGKSEAHARVAVETPAPHTKVCPSCYGSGGGFTRDGIELDCSKCNGTGGIRE